LAADPHAHAARTAVEPTFGLPRGLVLFLAFDKVQARAVGPGSLADTGVCEVDDSPVLTRVVDDRGRQKRSVYRRAECLTGGFLLHEGVVFCPVGNVDRLVWELFVSGGDNFRNADGGHFAWLTVED